MVVCSKRRSIKAIAENAHSERGDQKEREVEEKPKVNEKKTKKKNTDNAFVGIEEKGVIQKKSQEKSVSGRRNSRSSSNKSGEVKHQYGGNELSSHDALEVKTESKKETDARKKKGVASFLKRMKQNSPSEELENDDEDADDIDNNNDADDDGDGDLEKESKDSKVEEEKNRTSESKRDVKRERVTRSSRGRGVREESGRVKQGMGRPKRSETTTVATGKRGRDDGESEGGGVVRGGSKKRTRR